MIALVVFAKISETENFPIAELMKYVDEKKQKKLNEYRFLIDRKLSLYAAIIVRTEAMRNGIKNIRFQVKENGKPYLTDCPSFCFNISHTKNAVAVAFSDSEIGVDIEKISRYDTQIAKHNFTESERNYIEKRENPDAAFYEIWTKKEAYIKYTGEGLNTPLNSFCVLDNDRIKTFFQDEYVVSVCQEDVKKFSDKLTVISETKLISEFIRINNHTHK
jgi:4'-phosphopantetheinyl transferase